MAVVSCWKYFQCDGLGEVGVFEEVGGMTVD